MLIFEALEPLMIIHLTDIIVLWDILAMLFRIDFIFIFIIRPLVLQKSTSIIVFCENIQFSLQNIFSEVFKLKLERLVSELKMDKLKKVQQ